MTAIRHLFVFALLTLLASAAGASNWRMVGVVFDPGQPTAQIADALEGDESVMYRFIAKEGQVLSVNLEPGQKPVDFIVYAPGKWPGDEMHNSGTDGSRDYEARIDRDGHWAILVFRDLEGGVPAESGAYDLEINLE